MSKQIIRQLVDAAAGRYRSAGRFAFHFASGKLGHDPAFTALLEHGLVPDGARILDIGCGQGLMAAWLLAARQACEAGRWPAGWPPAPRPAALHGIELMPREVERARTALGAMASFVAGDMRKAAFGTNDVVVMLDVLHYVSIAEQDQVLQRVRDSLSPGGRLLLRVGDAGGGLPFLYSVWVDRLVALLRGRGWAAVHCRPLGAWRAKLEQLGFSVRTVPISQGAPFANILLLATLA